MGRRFVFGYGLVAYAVFLATLLYAIGFVTGLGVPKDIDAGPVLPPGQAIAVDLALLAAFALQHNVMARLAFKRWWTRFVPGPIERSTFVLVASLLLGLLCWQWRPLPDPVWEVETRALRAVLTGLSLAGFGLVVFASFVIDHFDLFGLRQVWLHLHGRPYEHPPFQERSLYRWVRHPLMLGLLVAFWSAPTMSQGRLLFAAVSTAWILVSIRIEERTLLAVLGEEYRSYRERTSMLLPLRPPPGRG
jgi:protein-S-isoprenylcysteine O-methyltransferase Ste14